MKVFAKLFTKESIPYWLGAIICLSIVCFVLLYFSEAQIPTIFTSSGIVAIISAVMGVMLTAFAMSMQLAQQSDAEAQKDKDVKLYQEKIAVFSKFTEKMWNMIDDENITIQALKELRKECFNKLVFYLNEKQIKKMAEFIAEISYEDVADDNLEDKDTANLRSVFADITHLLQGILKEKKKKEKKEDENEKKGSLILLYNSFHTEKPESLESNKQTDSKNQPENQTQNIQQKGNDPTYWHFNMLNIEKQINAFKNGNWVLALIEYGEEWRTNLLKQVREGDVIFLFKRGGKGYIGAFRAIGYEIIEESNPENKDTAKYDIYGGLEDGATLCSNILVEPIAYNYKGVGYYTVRRRTIERMNDTEAVKYLLTRFAEEELDEDRKSGAGRLDENTDVKLDSDYFNKLLQMNNLNK
ncbi:MAG: hypothetical protein LBR26_15440 [Prevotella sp.]|jgi:hypothetical protein|nr:hypothetical protein [Prevotella sp.]